MEINLLKCEGCGACQTLCQFGAVTGGRLITIHMRDIDIQNTTKLYEIEGLQVLNHPTDLKIIIQLKKTPLL